MRTYRPFICLKIVISVILFLSYSCVIENSHVTLFKIYVKQLISAFDKINVTQYGFNFLSTHSQLKYVMRFEFWVYVYYIMSLQIFKLQTSMSLSENGYFQSKLLH